MSTNGNAPFYVGQELKLVQILTDHNNKKCSATFGKPFVFDGPLMQLPNELDGKATHLFGLTPYTVEHVVDFPYDRRQEGYSACSWGTASEMISKLQSLNEASIAA